MRRRISDVLSLAGGGTCGDWRDGGDSWQAPEKEGVVAGCRHFLFRAQLSIADFGVLVGFPARSDWNEQKIKQVLH